MDSPFFDIWKHRNRGILFSEAFWLWFSVDWCGNWFGNTAFFIYQSGDDRTDGWLFCVTGIYSGGNRNLVLLILSGWLCAGYILIGILRKKYRRKDKIAFAPFVFVTQVILECLM